MKITNCLISISLLSFLNGCDPGKDGSKGLSSPTQFVDSSGSTAPSASSSSDAVATNPDKLYKDLIESERNARLAEDEKLQAQINELNDKVAALESKLDNEIAKLQAKDIELAQQVTELENDFGLDLSAIKETLKTKADSEYLEALILEIRKEISDSAESTKIALMSDYNRQIEDLRNSSATKAEMEVALAEVNKKIAAAEQAANEAVEALKAEIYTKLQDYATKSELDNFKNRSEQARLALEGRVLSTIAESMKIVFDKFDDVEKNIKEEVNNLRNETSKDIEVKYQEFLALKSLLMSDDVNTDNFKDLGGLLGFLNSVQGDLQDQLNVQVERFEKLSDQVSQNMDAIAANKLNISTIKEKQRQLYKRMKLNEDQIQQVEGKVDELRDDFNTQLAEIANVAREAASQYSPELQEQFAKLATDIASLKSSAVNKKELFYAELAEKYGLSVAQVKAALGSVTDDLVSASRDALKEMIALQLRLGDNLGDPSNPYNEILESKVDMNACKGNDSYTFYTVLGMDSLQYLIQSYNQGFFYGQSRDLYYGIVNSISPEDHLANKIVAQLTQSSFDSKDIAVADNCLNQVKNYQSTVLGNIILPSEATSDVLTQKFTQIRSKLLADEQIKRQLANFQKYMMVVNSKSSAFESALVSYIKKSEFYLSSPESVKKQITNQIFNMISSEATGTSPSLLSSVSSHVMNIAIVESILETKTKMLTSYTDEIKSLASKSALSEVIGSLDKLFASYANFNANLNNKVDALKSDITDTQSALKNVIDVLSAHLLSSGDVPKEWFNLLEDANRNISSTPISPVGLTPEISNVQHYFSSDSYRSDMCNPDFISLDGGVRTRLMHGGWNACWLNYRSYAPSQITSTSSNIIYRLFGTMKEVNMKVKDAVSGSLYYEANYNFSDEDSRLVNHGSFVNSVFDIKDSQSLSKYIASDCYLQQKSGGAQAGCINGWNGVKIDFTPSIVEGEVGTTYQYQIQLYSPLVLDFNSIGALNSTPVMGSKVKFDLDANGIKENTGWVRGQEGGFLVLDHNENGIIDNGSELFGQATMCNGIKSKNGFEALKCLDKNKDGVINTKDNAFKVLKVWFDNDLDGISSPSELKSLADLGVEDISVNYELNQSDTRIVNGNDHRFQAKFNAKGCPEQGCKVYDIFFNSSVELSAK